MAAVYFTVPMVLTSGESVDMPFVGCSMTGNVKPDTYTSLSVQDVLNVAQDLIDSDGEYADNKLAGIMSHFDIEFEKMGI